MTRLPPLFSVLPTSTPLDWQFPHILAACAAPLFSGFDVSAIVLLSPTEAQAPNRLATMLDL